MQVLEQQLESLHTSQANSSSAQGSIHGMVLKSIPQFPVIYSLILCKVKSKFKPPLAKETKCTAILSESLRYQKTK